ncbi:uncharacterized protein LOC119665764 [Teleopsis dalmanni]|uniref:uncharacterized protein LOC119665764 n=1 Tax=Teleopsis dalmanni TaxID=139649 RepID=UPI0018CC95A0|nr:uncharacterized protein LOC119665764 [Teleopsis dalmanni]
MEIEEIDQVIQHQKDIEGEIQRIWINFKKDSSTRYSKQYFETRLENLRQKWDAFEDNNDNLIKNLKPDNEYITKNYYGQLQQRRNEIENRFNNELEIIRQMEQKEAQVSRHQVIRGQEEARSLRNQDISINDEVTITGPCDITNKRLAILSTSLLQIKETIDLTKNQGDFIQLESIYEEVYIQLQEELNVRSQNVSETRTTVSNNIKLPPLNVPIFNSRFEEWCPFWELLVQQNHNLVDVERMQYLKGSLRGEAARLINHLTITANNYTAAVELLKQRYNNPAILVDNLINKLLSLRAIRNENAQDLKTLVDSSREVLYGIRNLNVDTSSWDPLIIQILLPKLDGETRKLYQHSRGASTQIPKLSSLYEFIESRVRGLEAIRDTNRENKNNFRPTAVNTKTHGKPTVTNNISKQRMPTLKNTTETEVTASYNIQKEKTVLLAAAMVIIRTKKQVNPIRALLDQGSQSCIITEQLARSIRAPLTNYQTHVKGINGQTTSVIAKCSLEIQSIHDENKSCHIEAIVLPKITSKMPNAEFTPGKWSHIDGLQLADPWYAEPKEIQLLIGSDVLPEVFKEGLIKGPDNSPMAQNRTFRCRADEYLKRFWELEEIPNADLRTVEERHCGRHYDSTCTRDKTGRYNVRLPLKNDRETLGKSRKMALKRFFSLEERFKKNPALKQEYVNFRREYIKLGHMKEVNEKPKTKVYYLPHHAVIKEDNTTTKFRVVFDASAKTTSGQSLNSIMMTGPTLQKDLFILLLQWRMFKIVFTADIEEMYRQILIYHDDRDLQRILLRNDQKKPIKEYKLNTITYGTASAPYLAIKTLLKLAEDERTNYPLASETLNEKFYVDDCLGGANTIKECKQVQEELIQLLRKGGFNLRKWASNEPEMLVNIQIKDIEPGSKYTKRAILSDAGKLFDPFGWLSPVTIKAKIMIQKLWMLGISWDTEIPPNLQAQWEEFKLRLPAVQKITMKRWTQHSENSLIELHGFADASEAGYAAVVYTKVINAEKVTISLVASKTKVAPIKQVSLARLELCAAVLLIKLINYIQKNNKITYSKVIAWSDSKIVLNWLRQYPNRCTTFVANRVSYIQDTFKGQFRFVPGKDNPADIPSRGVYGDNLISNILWWPIWTINWLIKDERNWPENDEVIDLNLIPETRKTAICNVVDVTKDENIINRFSSLNKLLRVTAYCLRFVYNCHKKKSVRKIDNLSADDIDAAEIVLVKQAEKCFSDDIRRLNLQKQLMKSNKLCSLNPFVDSAGVLRVGSRLRNADLSDNQKYSIILHTTSTLAKLIINQEHINTIHGGLKLTLNYVREKFWIIRGTIAVKACINKCLKCFRIKAKGQSQLMGSLPTPRVNFSRPFTHCGIDYAGPLHIKCSQFRGIKTHKAYIAIFVCLASQGFLAALKRMISRRGSVHHIYSDNGTNFTGANNILQKIQIENHLAETGIRWHFIPPGSPHFGGLWESGVKSIKYHLARIIGDQKLTYEELSTVLIQIECCLNSRPLCPLTDNIEDLNALTPGHFIVGSSLMTLLPITDSVKEGHIPSNQEKFPKLFKEATLIKAEPDTQNMLPFGNTIRNKEVVSTKSTAGD